MSGGSRSRRLFLSGLASLLILPILQAPVAAAVSCTFDLQQGRVTIEMSGRAIIEVGPPEGLSSDADRILFGTSSADTPCIEVATSRTDASVTNVARIVVNGSTGNDELIISRAGGEFAPGRSLTVGEEGTGLPEIEFTVNLRGGFDRFVISGGIGNRTLVFGNGSAPFRHVALNDDNDADITFLGVEELVGRTGEGNDRLSAQGGNGAGTPLTASVFFTGSGGRDSIVGGTARDFLNGGPGPDTLDGAEGNDLMDGGAGSDTTIGGPDNDELFSAEAPGDTFVPGPGIDLVSGSAAGRDTVSYPGASGPVNVNLGSGEATGEGDDILSSIENVTGSDFGDTLSGNADRNILNGRGGDDLLQGAQEADTLFPGPGIDDVRGGAGLDTIAYLDSNVPVVVNLGAGTATAQGTDTIVLVENATGSLLRDSLTGSAGPNVLVGFNGDDDLFGLGGDDILDGGNGNDDLDGGPGTDLCGQAAGTGTLISCENVGTFAVKPRHASVEAGDPLTYLVTWTHPRRWRRLDTVELRVRHGDRVLSWVRWNQEGNTFQLFDPRDDRFGPATNAGSGGTLDSPFARLHLRGSDAEALGPKTIAVLMRLSFRPSAIGEQVVEVTAEDDRNNRNAWEQAGTLRVLS